MVVLVGGDQKLTHQVILIENTSKVNSILARISNKWQKFSTVWINDIENMILEEQYSSSNCAVDIKMTEIQASQIIRCEWI